jgi:hypothetical protein
VLYALGEGLCVYFLLGRNGLNLTGEYQGTPVTDMESGEESPTGVVPLGLGNRPAGTGPLVGTMRAFSAPAVIERPEMTAVQASPEELKEREAPFGYTPINQPSQPNQSMNSNSGTDLSFSTARL